MPGASVHSRQIKLIAERRTEMKALIERVKQLTGVYSLGFDMASFMGIALPIGFVVLVGGGLAALVLLR